MHARYAKHRAAASQDGILYYVVLAIGLIIFAVLFGLWAWSVVALAMQNADTLHPIVTTAIFFAYSILVNKAMADYKHRQEQREIRTAVRTKEKALLARVAASVQQVIDDDAE